MAIINPVMSFLVGGVEAAVSAWLAGIEENNIDPDDAFDMLSYYGGLARPPKCPEVEEAKKALNPAVDQYKKKLVANVTFRATGLAWDYRFQLIKKWIDCISSPEELRDFEQFVEDTILLLDNASMALAVINKLGYGNSFELEEEELETHCQCVFQNSALFEQAAKFAKKIYPVLLPVDDPIYERARKLYSTILEQDKKWKEESEPTQEEIQGAVLSVLKDQRRRPDIEIEIV